MDAVVARKNETPLSFLTLVEHLGPWRMYRHSWGWIVDLSDEIHIRTEEQG